MYQATTESKRDAHPFSQCSRCQVFLCLSKKRNCFVEYHDERLLETDEDNLEAVEAVDFSEEDEGEAAEDNIHRWLSILHPKIQMANTLISRDVKAT